MIQHKFLLILVLLIFTAFSTQTEVQNTSETSVQTEMETEGNNSNGCDLKLESKSYGNDDGNYAKFYINSNSWTKRNRGICILETSSYGNNIHQDCFDTHCCHSESDRLRDFLNGLSRGRLVMFAVADEASNNLKGDAKDAIRRYGLSSSWDFNTFRGSFAAIGYKDAPNGSAVHYQTNPHYGGASVSTCINDKVYRPSGCSYYVQAESRGFIEESNIWVKLNGYDVNFNSYKNHDGRWRGICVVQINQYAQEISKNCYDTYNSSNESYRLRDFLRGLNNGDLVVFTVSDEASNNLTSDCKSEIRKFGFPSGWNFNYYRGSFAAIGYKGQSAYGAPYQEKESGKGPSRAGKCLDCHPKCQHCSSYSTCEVCKGNSSTRSSSGNCDCLPGYYESGYTDCYSCSSVCETCNSSNQCTSCRFGRDLSSGCYECLENYYPISNGDCNSCVAPCLSCSDLNTCLTCQGENRTAPECDCDTGFYQDDSGNCVPCDVNCVECTGPDSCTSCKSGRVESSTCADCLENHYPSESSGKCIECVSPCLDCTDAETCLSCLGENRDAPLCECSEGFYESEGECVACDNNCSKCNGSICTACKSGRIPSETCSECLVNHYSVETGECLGCVAPCLECSDESTCITCHGENRTAPECDCDEGFFLNGEGFCVTCDSNCLECTGADQCTVCKTGRSESSNCSECSEGYFEDMETGECVECVFPCTSCTSETSCLTCSGEHRVEPECFCDLGFYSNEENSCVACDSNCLECTGENECIICRPGRVQSETCSECYENYFEDVDGECNPCGSSCLTCSDYNTCLTCKGDNRVAPDCVCAEGYEENEAQNCVLPGQESEEEDEDEGYQTQFHPVQTPYQQWQVDQTTEPSGKSVSGVDLDEYAVCGQITAGEVSQEDKLLLFRLTSLDDTGDVASLGGNSLAAYYQNGEIFVVTYNAETDESQVSDAVPTTFELEDLQESPFFIYLGYSSALSQVYGAVQLSGGQYHEILIENVSHNLASSLTLFVGSDNSEDSNFVGTYQNWYLATGSGSFLDDEIQLTPFRRLFESQNEDCVLVFSKCNFSGKFRAICDQDPSIDFEARSILVPEGIVLTLYSDAEFQGQSAEFRESFECNENIGYRFLQISNIQFKSAPKLRKNIKKKSL